MKLRFQTTPSAVRAIYLIATFSVIVASFFRTIGTAFANVKNSPPNEQVLSATILTTLGEIKVKLYPNEVPNTVANFVHLAKSGFYDGLKFHKRTQDYIIQTGDKTGQGNGHAGYYIQDEWHPLLTNKTPGMVSMANFGPGTNSSQFFITLTPAAHLNHINPVFGKVTDGLEIVTKISKEPKPMTIIHSISINPPKMKLQAIKKYPVLTEKTAGRKADTMAKKLLANLSLTLDLGDLVDLKRREVNVAGLAFTAYYQPIFKKKPTTKLMVVGEAEEEEIKIREFQFQQTDPPRRN